MIDSAWQEITLEVIEKSFKNIGQNLDSKPEEIKYLKEDLTLTPILEKLIEFWDEPENPDFEWMVYDDE